MFWDLYFSHCDLWTYIEITRKVLLKCQILGTLTTSNMLNKKHERWDLTDAIFNNPAGNSSAHRVQSQVRLEFLRLSF